MRELPTFLPTPQEFAERILQDVFSKPDSTATFLHDIIYYPDHHFRVIFHRDYFTVQPGNTDISKSQWNTLKKKLKRHHPGIFVFKAHGVVDAEKGHLYIDFGFLAPRE